MQRLLLAFVAFAALGYLIYRRSVTLRRLGSRIPFRERQATPGEPAYPEQPEQPEPGGPIPRSAGEPGEPHGLTAGELEEGVWPGRAEALVRERYPSLTNEDLAAAGNDLEKLAGIIAERTHQPFHEVYEDLLATAREASPLEQDQQAL